MNLRSEWLSDGGNVPQGLNACDTWMARVSGPAGSMPLMPDGLVLTTASDLGGGTMVLAGIYQGTSTTAPTHLVDAGGGPAWTVLAFTPSANPSLTWNAGQQQCLPTAGFNPGAGAGNPAKPAQPAPLPPPVQITPPVKAPAPVTGASDATTILASPYPWIALVGGVAVMGLLAAKAMGVKMWTW